MDRRALLSRLGLCTLSPFAGCLGSRTQIAQQFDCQNTDQPEPNVRAGIEQEVKTHGEVTVYESVGSTTYPTLPSAFDNEALRAYIEAYEPAFQQNEAVARYGSNVVGFGVRVDKSELLDFGDTTTVRLDFSVHEAILQGSRVMTTEPGPEASVYAIDETGLVRAEAPVRDSLDGSVREATPNPLEEGTLLTCF